MQVSRRPILPALALVTTVAALCACDSEVTPGPDIGAGGATSATTTDATSTASTSTASTGQGGGVDCNETDSACICDACAADGGTCLDYCNFPPFKQCYFPEPPGDRSFSCGGAVTCAEDEACVRGTPMGDGCDTYACAALPSACVDDPSCACVEAHIEDPYFEPSCEEENGHVTVFFPGGPPDTPFTEGEVCGDLTCDVGEHCVSCSDPEFPGDFFSDDCVVDEVPEGSFRCGTTTCRVGLEYCHHDPGFEPCIEWYLCRPLPDCPEPCDCIDLGACDPGASCGRDADGNVQVSCYEG